MRVTYIFHPLGYIFMNTIFEIKINTQILPWKSAKKCLWTALWIGKLCVWCACVKPNPTYLSGVLECSPYDIAVEVVGEKGNKKLEEKEGKREKVSVHSCCIVCVGPGGEVREPVYLPKYASMSGWQNTPRTFSAYHKVWKWINNLQSHYICSLLYYNCC